MADLKEICRVFEMSITDFAKLIGYTRQGLYNAVNGKSSHGRMYSSMKLLKRESDLIYQKEIEMADQRRKDRENAITELSQSCGLISPVGKPDIYVIDTGRQRKGVANYEI